MKHAWSGQRTPTGLVTSGHANHDTTALLCAGEETERKTQVEVDGQHQARLDREGKERKTQVDVDGQHQARLDREGIIRRRGTEPS